MFKKKRDIDRLLVCMLDLLCIIVSYIRTWHTPFNELSEYSLVLLIVVHIAIFYLGNHYDHLYKRGYLDEAKAVFNYEFQLVICMMALIFLTKGTFSISRRGMLCFVGTDYSFVYLIHILMKKYRIKIYPEKSASKKVYLVTTKDRVDQILTRMERSGVWNEKIVAIALYDDYERAINKVHGIKVVANCKDYIAYARYEAVDEVFIHLPNSYELDMEVIISQFELMGANVSFNLNAFELEIDCDKRVQKLAGYSVVTFSVNHYDYRDLIAKRIIDICGALVGLMITGVVSIVLVPLIKLESKGPAIFSQERVGKNGRVFKFYKFRSMYEDAEKRKAELLAQNEMQGLMFKMEHDPRITKIGGFIRKTSLDELPQFYNVLKGDMSLVGTRPPTIDEYRQYEAHQKRRLSAKPGITGMWQVSGRSDITDFNEVIRLDLEYIDNWSVWMDIKIIVKTVWVILHGDGAI